MAMQAKVNNTITLAFEWALNKSRFLLKLKTDEFPDVAPPWLTVGVIYPGASPEVVEKEVLDLVAGEEFLESKAGPDRADRQVAHEVTMRIRRGVADLSEATGEPRVAISVGVRVAPSVVVR